MKDSGISEPTEAGLSVREQRFDDRVVLSTSGRLDSNTCEKFERTILDVIEPDIRVLVVDLCDLVYISSAGLRVLLLAAQKSKAMERDLVLCNLTAHVREVFDISGFSSIFPIYRSVEEALGGCPRTD